MSHSDSAVRNLANYFQLRRSEPTRVTLDEFRRSASIVGFVPLAGRAPTGGTFADAFDLSAPNRLNDVRLLYAVVYVDEQGQSLGFSELAEVEPVTSVAEAPRGLKVDLSQEALTLTWQAPGENIDDTPSGQLIGYNVYRATAPAKTAERPLNAAPVTAAAFSDRLFEFGAEYTYTVRALTGVRGRVIESADSQPVVIKTIDTFAPAAPTAITIASAAGTVSLFWPANSEADVAGYNVYRADAADAPPDRWVKLNAALVPHPPTSFTDNRVEVGKRYYYRITAVDRFGNESPRSEATSEQVNP